MNYKSSWLPSFYNYRVEVVTFFSISFLAFS